MNYPNPIEHFTQETQNNQPKLTDEEVWLRAYCAAISGKSSDRHSDAEKCLREFKERFRND